jgi:hypothetical protein
MRGCAGRCEVLGLGSLIGSYCASLEGFKTVFALRLGIRG